MYAWSLALVMVFSYGRMLWTHKRDKRFKMSLQELESGEYKSTYRMIRGLEEILFLSTSSLLVWFTTFHHLHTEDAQLALMMVGFGLFVYMNIRTLYMTTIRVEMDEEGFTYTRGWTTSRIRWSDISHVDWFLLHVSIKSEHGTKMTYVPVSVDCAALLYKRALEHSKFNC